MVDTGRHLDEGLLSLFDIAARVILVGTQTLAAVKNVRFVMDLFDKLEYPPDKLTLVLNRVSTDRNLQKFAISKERIEKFLKRPVEVEIPSDEATALAAMSKGVLIVAQRDHSRSPVKEFMQLSELLYSRLMGDEDQESESAQQHPDKNKRLPGLSLRFGKS